MFDMELMILFLFTLSRIEPCHSEVQAKLVLNALAEPEFLIAAKQEKYWPKKSIDQVGKWQNSDGNCIFVKDVVNHVRNAAYELRDDPCMLKEYKVDVFDVEPYASLILDFTKTAMKDFRANIGCSETEFDNFTISMITQLRSNQSSNFNLPFLAYKDSAKVHRHHFLPILEPPGAFYIARKSKVAILSMIIKCVRVWPLIMFATFISLIAGFVIWILELRSNPDEFPLPFFLGWFEGIWLSVVSMTTVGYGDKVPKTIVGRLFSIIWITGGILIFCILAGEVTTVILDSKRGNERSMVNSKVGTLDRLYEKSLVALRGGYLQATNKEKDGNEMQQLNRLTKRLWKGYIDGILMDKFTYRYMQNKLQDSSNPDINFFLHDTVIADIPHSGRKVAYGMLFRSNELKKAQKQLHDTLKDILEDKLLTIQMTAAQSYQTKLKTKEKDDENDFYRDNFLGNLVIILAALVLIFVLGVLYEVWRWMKTRRQ